MFFLGLTKVSCTIRLQDNVNLRTRHQNIITEIHFIPISSGCGTQVEVENYSKQGVSGLQMDTQTG